MWNDHSLLSKFQSNYFEHFLESQNCHKECDDEWLSTILVEVTRLCPLRVHIQTKLRHRRVTRPPHTTR